MKNINKLNQTRSNKNNQAERNKNNKIKSLGLEFKLNNLEHSKDWTKEFQSFKLKSAGNASFSKIANKASRSSGDKKSDALFDNLITIEELADYIGVSQKTIRNWISLRSIPFLRIGKKTFFRFEKINGWFKTKEFEPCQ